MRSTVEYIGWISELEKSARNRISKDDRPRRKGILQHTWEGIPFLRKNNGEKLQIRRPTKILWRICDGKRNVREISEDLATSIGISDKPGEVESAVIESIRKLNRAGLIEVGKNS
ncbi:MAG: hypothetical protein GF416_07040 [Candidatus Altiarchaeales archaeon]|nr:hypothetical protein [Candidatus Altiarchaeales archaeon]MBD3416868.1 hypothetical protein [Candidatus Altiarchaeales archaeon]